MKFDVLNISVTEAIKIFKNRISYHSKSQDLDLPDLDSDFIFVTVNEKEINLDFDIKCELKDIENLELQDDWKYLACIDFFDYNTLSKVV